MDMNIFVLLGILFILIGAAILIISGLFGRPELKVGVGGFIGPFPFGFANDRGLLYIIIAVIAVAFVLFHLLR